MATDFATCFATALGICLLAWRLSTVWKWLLLAVFVYLAANIDPRADLVLYIGLFSWGLLCFLDSGLRLALSTSIFVVLAAFSVLVKANFLVLVGLSSLLIILDLAARGQIWATAWIVVGLIAAFLGGWHVAGQDFSNLKPFFLNSIPIVLGYDQTVGMAGSNAAAQRGILIRDGVALEKAGEVTAVVFDKTGTLTAGKMSVVAKWGASSRSEQSDLLTIRVAAELARHSKHPISQAIAGSLQAGANITEWKEIRGAGVQGTVDGQTAKLGSLAWLEQSGIDWIAEKDFVDKWTGDGASVIGLAIGNSLAALFAVKDTLKEGAADVVRRIQRQGLRVCLVTGDNHATAESVAKQVGIAPENVFAQVRPEEKSEFVKKLQQRGERVAFVGDGINDAPALAKATVGVSMSEASQIAMQTAQVVLMGNGLRNLPTALGLGKHTYLTIKQNLFWAFFYNIIAIPVAAFGFLTPTFGALVMGFSDVILAVNSVRLFVKKVV